MPKLDFPYRTAKMTPVLGQDERLTLLRELVNNEPPRPLPHRAAGLLLLLYAQPINRIAALRTDQLAHDEHGATITFDEQPVPIPEPFASVITEHRDSRPNMNIAANVGSAWLFPGYRAGQHLHPGYLRPSSATAASICSGPATPPSAASSSPCRPRSLPKPLATAP